MLAARAEGIGSCLTQVLVFRAQETMEVLEVPPDEHWIMSACVSMGYPTGRWGVPLRRPVHEVTSRNRWGGELGMHIPVPLWSPGEGRAARED